MNRALTASIACARATRAILSGSLDAFLRVLRAGGPQMPQLALADTATVYDNDAAVAPTRRPGLVGQIMRQHLDDVELLGLSIWFATPKRKVRHS